MATYDFTGANGDPLPSGLTARSGTFEIQSNRLAPTGAAPSLPTWVFTGQGAADGDVELNVDISSTSGVGGLAVRLNPVDNSHIFIRARYDGGGSTEGIVVYTFDGGYTEISSTLCTVGVSPTVKVEMSGTDFTVSINGVVEHTFSTSFNQTQIHHGARLNNSNQSVDDLVINTASGATDTVSVGEADYSNIVYQRDASNVSSVSFPVAYTGTPTSLRYRLLNSANDAVVTDWTVFDASPTGGASTLTFDAPADIIGYKVEVDFSNDATVSDVQSVVWRVGDNIWIGGQSLAEDFDTDGAVTVIEGYYKFNGSQGVQPTTGIGAYTIAKAIIDAENVAVMVVNTADGGTPLTQEAGDSDWWNRASGGTLWSNSVTQVNAMTAGKNKLAFVWWHQGTRDSLAGVSKSVYQTQLGEFFTRVRSTFAGYDDNPLTVLSALLGRDIRGGATDASHQAIRNAQIDYAATDSNLYPITAYLSANEDGVHATDAAYELLSQQISLQWLTVKGLTSTSAPRIASTSQGANTSEVLITFDTDLDSSDTAYSIEGVRVEDDSAPLTVSSFERTDSRTAAITVSETPSGSLSVWFCYGVGSTNNQLTHPRATEALPNGAGNFSVVAESFSNQSVQVNQSASSDLSFSVSAPEFSVSAIAAPAQSTLNAVLTGIPDGTYSTRVVIPSTGEVVAEEKAWASGSASFTLPVPVGTSVEYYAYDTGSNEAGLQLGVTE